MSTAAHAVLPVCAGDIRLFGGSVPSQGRVELFYEGEWRRVLIDMLHPVIVTAEARVACRQAGYPYTEGTLDFGQWSGPVWLEILTCTGDEERLEQCIHWGWKEIVFHINHDRGVRCGGECVWREKDTHIVSSVLTQLRVPSHHHTISSPSP